MCISNSGLSDKRKFKNKTKVSAKPKGEQKSATTHTQNCYASCQRTTNNKNKKHEQKITFDIITLTLYKFRTKLYILLYWE